MYSILIADDEPIERMFLSKIIKKHYGNQLEIVQAVNGREAISLFEEKNCKIAILDIEMPGINGLAAAEEIRKKDKDCSIIFLTAFDEFGYAKKAISVKALDYLLKPCPEEELISALDEAIRLLDEREELLARLQKAEGEADGIKGKQDNVTADEGNVKPETVRSNLAKSMILEYIHTHYKEDISLHDVAGSLHYSEAYFCKLFRQCFDKNFTTYIAEYRIEKAKQLLSDPMINIKEAGEEAGYRDANYFTKVFKRVTGFTPSEYRMKALNMTAYKE